MANWTHVLLASTLIAAPVAACAQAPPADSPYQTAPLASTTNSFDAPRQNSAYGNPEQEPQSVNASRTSRAPTPESNNPQSATASAGLYTDDAGGSARSRIGPRVPTAPPLPATEFQRLVTATLGEELPIFGADLFEGVPSTFAPLADVPVPADYVIGPGDDLRVHVWGQVNFNANVRVNSTGAIYLPQVGQIHVAGLAASALDTHLRAAIGRIFRNFDLSVELGQLRSIEILIVGQARRPGAYTVSSLSTLVNALFYSGGPSPQGSMRRIELKRGPVTVTTFDLYDLLAHGDKSHDAALMPGDVIFIPPVGPQVALAGSVRNPAIYELKDDSATGSSIATLLDLAGGRSSVAADSRISIERISSHHSQEAMQVASDTAGLATPVRDGDLVRLLSLVPRLDSTVTLRGNLANPGHFAWHEGMRLSELIPDKQSLITRDYWLRRDRLGLPAPEFEPDTRSDAPSQTLTGSRRQDVETGAQQAPGTISAAQQHVQTENTLAASTTREVTLAAPEIDWAYAVIERLDVNTLTTSLIPFDLGRLVLQLDSSQDLLLQPGDTVTIFSKSDIRVPLTQQTKFVRLEGEFVRSGVYSVLPGETLRALVQRAGGLAPDSYLYGSEFTRVSTRAIQQQRLDEYVQSLQIQLQRNRLALASTAVSAQDAQSAENATDSQQGLLSRLRQIRASGRIVLESAPVSATVASLPDLPLEDGDRFIVPPRPASINVVGSVYDQNSFLHTASRRAGDYLRLAGGPTPDADPRRAFIIRADGSVLSRNSTATLWGNNFDGERLYPGDTLVLPEKVYKLSALHGFLDWGQLFSQFALGAAAINVIK